MFVGYVVFSARKRSSEEENKAIPEFKPQTVRLYTVYASNSQTYHFIKLVFGFFYCSYFLCFCLHGGCLHSGAETLLGVD